MFGNAMFLAAPWSCDFLLWVRYGCRMLLVVQLGTDRPFHFERVNTWTLETSFLRFRCRNVPERVPATRISQNQSEQAKLDKKPVRLQRR